MEDLPVAAGRVSLSRFIRSRCRRLVGGKRKIEAKRGPTAGNALHLDLAAMQFDDVSRNGEPQPSAPGIARLAAIHAIVPVEDARQLITRNAATSVDDAHSHARLVQWHDLDLDDPGGRGVAHGILDEILQHAFDHPDIRVHLRMLNSEVA